MELANGVVVREHGRTKRGPTEVGVFFIWQHIILRYEFTTDYNRNIYSQIIDVSTAAAAFFGTNAPD